MEPVQILDTILEIIKNKTTNTISATQVEEQLKLRGIEYKSSVRAAIERLFNDDNLRKFHNNEYTISFQGENLLRAGGYQQAELNLAQEQQRQQKIEDDEIAFYTQTLEMNKRQMELQKGLYRMNVILAAVGSVAALYYLIEIVHLLGQLYFHSQFQFWFAVLALILTLLLLYFCRKRIWKIFSKTSS